MENDTAPNATQPKSRRCWYQFGLRTLLTGVALLAVPCAYVGQQARIVRERMACRERMKGVAWFFSADRDDWYPGPGISWPRRLLGDEPIDSIGVDPGLKESSIQEIRLAFPEADISPIIRTYTRHENGSPWNNP